VLVLERRDLMLMNRDAVLDAFRLVADHCGAAIDEVYLVETHAGPIAVTWLKIGDIVADRCRAAWPMSPGYPGRRPAPRPSAPS